MTELIETLERRQVRQVPDFRVGDRVRVHFQVVEGNRRRTQVFEGVVLKEKGGGPQRTFTVRLAGSSAWSTRETRAANARSGKAGVIT